MLMDYKVGRMFICMYVLPLTGLQRIGRIRDYLGAIAVPAPKQGYTRDSSIYTQGC